MACTRVLSLCIRLLTPPSHTRSLCLLSRAQHHQFTLNDQTTIFNAAAEACQDTDRKFKVGAWLPTCAAFAFGFGFGFNGRCGHLLLSPQHLFFCVLVGSVLGNVAGKDVGSAETRRQKLPRYRDRAHPVQHVSGLLGPPGQCLTGLVLWEVANLGVRVQLKFCSK